LNILLTGASGFIGSALFKSLKNHQVTAIGRRKIECCHSFYEKELSSTEDYSDCLSNIDIVIHSAARAHVISDKLTDSFADYRAVNTEGTLNLARQAANYNCKRFVYLSSIGVNGLYSKQPFTEADIPYPHNAYARSKCEAEKGLLEIADRENMEVVIIRPPLVYGPMPPGNFASLLEIIKKGYPLPFRSVTNNKRSLIAVNNLVSFILLCADYKNTSVAANEIFVISDGDDVSTKELFERIAKAYGKKSPLFFFPPVLLRLVARVLGKQDIADRLLSSLQVDSSKARELLGWKPVVTMNEQLQEIVKADGCKGGKP